MQTQHRTAPTPTTTEAWLQALTGAMTHTTRSDGSGYWHLSEAAYWQPIRDQLQEICREAHRGEMPNDWRYELISDIAERLLEYSQPDSEPWDANQYGEIAFDVADSLASYSTVQLADWVSYSAGRGFFDDPGLVQGLACDIPTMLRWRQCEELQLMTLAIVHACDQLTAAG